MIIGSHSTHPLADVFPLMDDASLAQHADDIEANGQLTEIVLLDGKILDGRNTYMACVQRGIEPRFREYGTCALESSTALDYLARWVWMRNGSRRDLTPGARALCVKRLLKLCHVRKARKQPVLPGVKTETPHEAEAVLGGTVELQAAVERGEIPIEMAAQAAALSEDEQRGLVERLKCYRTCAIELTHDEIEALRDAYDRLGEHEATRVIERMVPEL